MSERSLTVVEVTHEWGRLEEAIVGIQPRDRFVIADPAGEYADPYFEKLAKEHRGENLYDLDPELATEFEREADGLAALLEERGVRVRRLQQPQGVDDVVGTGTGEGMLVFARDPIAVIGHRIIELTASEGWRERERFAVRPVITELMENSNATWVAMPPPAPSLPADGPRLEGGDILLNGSEIYVGYGGLLSTEAGARWLQQYLGDAYTVYGIPLSEDWMHLDGALSLLREGLALRAPDYLPKDLPGALRDFEFIDMSIEESDQLACNPLILDSKSIVMDAHVNGRIAREVERRGIEVVHHDYHVVQGLGGGGLRCSHHPIRRVID